MSIPSRDTGSRGEVIWPRAVLVVVLLYAFLIGVALLERGISTFGEGFEERLLTGITNPFAGLSAGILVTVLVQSSSVSTSAIVGLVGAGTMPVELAVPMVLGANIGTTITSTLAALGSVRRSDEFRRGFAAATVHDFYNLISVAILLPLELTTRFLSRSATALTSILRGSEVSEPGTSPLRAAVDLPIDLITRAVEAVTSLDAVQGTSYLVIGLGCIFLALGLITKNMRRLVAGQLQRAVNHLVGRGGGVLAIVLGLVITLAVQSSTITTSILVPLVASGVLSLTNAYPITLGANVGTTLTALIASLAVAFPEGLTIALVHTLFNLFALALLYPVPALRRLPIMASERLAALAVRRPSAVAIYVVGVFLVIPLTGTFVFG